MGDHNTSHSLDQYEVGAMKEGERARNMQQEYDDIHVGVKGMAGFVSAAGEGTCEGLATRTCWHLRSRLSLMAF